MKSGECSLFNYVAVTVSSCSVHTLLLESVLGIFVAVITFAVYGASALPQFYNKKQFVAPFEYPASFPPMTFSLGVLRFYLSRYIYQHFFDNSKNTPSSSYPVPMPRCTLRKLKPIRSFHHPPSAALRRRVRPRERRRHAFDVPLRRRDATRGERRTSESYRLHLASGDPIDCTKRVGLCA